jgi:hypothetical protein
MKTIEQVIKFLYDNGFTAAAEAVCKEITGT